VPSDGFLTTALEAEPGLLEHAFGRDVVIATPSTLLALLRTVAYSWRTERLARDAAAVLEVGRLLHTRLGTLSGHLTRLGPDRQRMNRLQAAGWRVFYVTAADLHHPERLVARIAAALATR